MARGKGIFDFDTLTPSLKLLLPKVDAGVDLAFDLMESEAETELRTNAPWHDNTGNARGGLRATHQAEPMVVHRLVMYHTVDYGYWLEIRWSGKYAIIGPTMFDIAPVLAANVASAVNRAVRS
jgi:hypothetical protein